MDVIGDDIVDVTEPSVLLFFLLGALSLMHKSSCTLFNDKWYLKITRTVTYKCQVQRRSVPFHLSVNKDKAILNNHLQKGTRAHIVKFCIFITIMSTFFAWLLDVIVR